MPRKRNLDRTAQDGTTVRISGQATKVMDGLIEAIEARTGDKMSPGEVILAGLKLLAKEIEPGLLSIQTGADLLAAAVAQAPTVPAPNSPAPRRAD